MQIDEANIRALRGLLLAGSILLPGAAFAQEQAPAATPDYSEIVVTARFRNESVQSVPIAITAVSGDSMTSRALRNIQDLSSTIPSVDFRGGSSSKDRTIFIRGIGTITTSPGVEPSVSTVLDGVVLTRPGQSTLDLGEVERVEVLRGPQGTLFGKNASAGVINIVTRDPTDDFHAYGEVGATTDEEYRVKAGVSGPLVPGKIDALIDGLYTNFAGNARNLFTGNKVNGFERYGARAKVLFKPTDSMRFTLAGDYLHSHDDLPTSIYLRTSQIAYPSGAVSNSAPLAAALASEGVTPGPGNTDTSTNFDTDDRDKNFGVSLTAEVEAGGYKVTSITAWRKWLNHQHQDYDSISDLSATFPQGEDFGDVDTRQFSQELRFTSPKGKFIDFVIGAYYLHADTDERYERDLTQLVGTAQTRTVGVAHYGITNDNYALFGEANINFTPHFRGIAGYRSTWDDLSFYHTRTSTADPNNTGSTALDKPGVRAYHNARGDTYNRGDSYRAGLQLDLGEHNQTYFTYSRGYKGPAYNVYFNMRSQFIAATNSFVPLDEIPLKPETSDSFEGGIKGSLANRLISYSLAIFTTKFHNYQANFNDVVGNPPAQVSRLINAGTARSRGVELDATVRPIEGLTLDFSGAYTDAKVIHFNCPAGAPTSCNIDGQPLPYAPKWKLYGNAAYRIPLNGDLGLELQSDVSWRSDTQFSLAETPGTIQPGYAIWNASVALLGEQNGWQVRAYVKNITDHHYATFLANGTFAGIVRYVPRDDSRFFGLLARKDF